MIGVDTDILIRYLVQDDGPAGRSGPDFLERRCSPDRPALVNRVVVAEFVRVLDRFLRNLRPMIA